VRVRPARLAGEAAFGRTGFHLVAQMDSARCVRHGCQRQHSRDGGDEGLGIASLERTAEPRSRVILRFEDDGTRQVAVHLGDGRGERHVVEDDPAGCPGGDPVG